MLMYQFVYIKFVETLIVSLINFYIS